MASSHEVRDIPPHHLAGGRSPAARCGFTDHFDINVAGTGHRGSTVATADRRFDEKHFEPVLDGHVRRTAVHTVLNAIDDGDRKPAAVGCRAAWHLPGSVIR